MMHGGVSLLYKDEAREKINCSSSSIEPVEVKSLPVIEPVEVNNIPVKKMAMVGGLSLLFKDDHHQQPKEKDCNNSSIFMGTEENVAAVDVSSLPCKEDVQEQKDSVNPITVIAEDQERVVVDKKIVENNVMKSDDSNNKDYYKFKMPLHFPRYTEKDYEKMSERELDVLLKDYGLIIDHGDLAYKKRFAIRAFLWQSTASYGEGIDQIYSTSQEKKKVISSIVERLYHALGFA